jgi:hypothetical protein
VRRFSEQAKQHAQDLFAKDRLATLVDAGPATAEAPRARSKSKFRTQEVPLSRGCVTGFIEPGQQPEQIEELARARPEL